VSTSSGEARSWPLPHHVPKEAGAPSRPSPRATDVLPERTRGTAGPNTPRPNRRRRAERPRRGGRRPSGGGPAASSRPRTARAAGPVPAPRAEGAGGTSLRFAMVHDVLHERYPRHGEAYYARRNRRALAELRKRESRQPFGRRDAGYFALLDDLGVGQEREVAG